MEKTEMPTTSSQSLKDEPILETPLSQDIDHNVERVKDITMKLEQLIVRFEPYTKPVEGMDNVMITLSPGEMQVSQLGKEPGQPVIELGKYLGRHNELDDEQRSIQTKGKQVLRFGAATRTLEFLKKMAKGWESFSEIVLDMNLDITKGKLKVLEMANGYKTENDALDAELSNLKSAILPLLEDVKQDVEIYSALKVEADKFVSKVKETMEAAGFQCKDGQSIHEMEMEQVKEAKFRAKLMESLEPKGPEDQDEQDTHEMKMKQEKDKSTCEKLVQEFIEVCTQLLEEFEHI